MSPTSAKNGDLHYTRLKTDQREPKMDQKGLEIVFLCNKNTFFSGNFVCGKHLSQKFAKNVTGVVKKKDASSYHQYVAAKSPPLFYTIHTSLHA